VGDVADDGGGIVARDVVDEQQASRVDHEGLIGIGSGPVDRDLDGQGAAGGGIAQGADLHGELLDVRAALGGAEVAVVVDLDAADVGLDARAQATAAEVLAEDRQVGALVVLTPELGPEIRSVYSTSGAPVPVTGGAAVTLMEKAAREALSVPSLTEMTMLE